MACGIFLGVLGGFAAFKLLRRWRCGFRGHHGHGRGRGRHGGGPLPFRYVVRRLGLDESQTQEARALWESVHGAIDGLRAERDRWPGTIAEAMGGDTFDRGKVEGAAAATGSHLASVRQELIDALARLHEVLTPEQRGRLTSLLGRIGDARHAGPYR